MCVCACERGRRRACVPRGCVLVFVCVSAGGEKRRKMYDWGAQEMETEVSESLMGFLLFVSWRRVRSTGGSFAEVDAARGCAVTLATEPGRERTRERERGSWRGRDCVCVCVCHIVST